MENNIITIILQKKVINNKKSGRTGDLNIELLSFTMVYQPE